MNVKEIPAETLNKYFTYLDDLRDSNRTNMFGAPSFLSKEFSLNKADAKSIWGAWRDTFDHTPVEKRVQEALA